MFRNMNLQIRLMGAFLIMALIVLVVGWAGWSCNLTLSERISTLSKDNLPGIVGLWKILEAQTQIMSGEDNLSNGSFTEQQRQKELTLIQDSWKQVEEGFKQYESTPDQTKEEKKLYQEFRQNWEKWKQAHEEYMQMYRLFTTFGMPTPHKNESDLLRRGKQNSPEMEVVKKAISLMEDLNKQILKKNEPTRNLSRNSLQALLNNQETFAAATQKQADSDVADMAFRVILSMVIGPITAIILGSFLSKEILKSISGVINIISSSAIEISTTVEQQERVANQQAISVNQTTTTMTELGASSRQAAEQAETSMVAARRVAKQVTRLSEQSREIGTITSIVSELASRTNMLAFNATIEAVRAGEYGKGFGVVATEIRKLADESKRSAEKINNLVVNIQSITDSTAIAENEERLESVVDAINTIVRYSQQISLTSKQQAIAIEQVVFAMNNINSGAQQTASGISQTKIGIQKLNEAAQALKVMGVR
jgi:methyl-accepting chemotaxis protein